MAYGLRHFPEIPSPMAIWATKQFLSELRWMHAIGWIDGIVPNERLLSSRASRQPILMDECSSRKTFEQFRYTVWNFLSPTFDGPEITVHIGVRVYLVEIVIEVWVTGAQVAAEYRRVSGEDCRDVDVPRPADDQSDGGQPLVEMTDDIGRFGQLPAELRANIDICRANNYCNCWPVST